MHPRAAAPPLLVALPILSHGCGWGQRFRLTASDCFGGTTVSLPSAASDRLGFIFATLLLAPRGMELRAGERARREAPPVHPREQQGERGAYVARRRPCP